MFGINILGTGSYSPPLNVTNGDMSRIVETNDEWITTRTGIKSRRLADGETAWTMGLRAAEEAIRSAGIDAKDIGLVIATTVTSDFFTPSLACLIQDAVGAENAAAFDLNAACTGFVYGLDTAKRFLQTDESLKYVLLVSSEILSRIVDYEDRSTCVLFGDGAAAVIIERSDKLYSSYLGSDGNGAKFLYARHTFGCHPFTDKKSAYGENFSCDKPFLCQDGKEVYKFATKALPSASRAAAEKIGFDLNGIDWFIPHQANMRIIETAAKSLGVSLDKFIINIEKHGNTSSASMPIALDEAVKEGKIKRGDKLCFVGFGAGLTLGSVICEF